jgi:NitT/TauT family transport system permease protein
VTIKRAYKIRAAQLAIVLVTAAVLELLVDFGAVNALVLSRPSRVSVRLWHDLGSSELWISLAVTARDVVVALALSLSIGTVIGYALHRLPTLRRALEPLLVAFYAAPAILLYPIFMIFLGQGSETVIVMSVVLATVPVAINVAVGLSGIAAIWRKVGRSLNATRSQMFLKIMVPAAMPTIVTGFRLGITFALVGVVALEFLTYSGGLGKLVSWRYFVFDTDGVYAAIVLVAAIAIVINALLSSLELWVRRRWG